MLNKETIEELRIPQAQKALQAEIEKRELDALAVPDGLQVQDLERYRPHRRRQVGTMITNCMDSLVEYVRSWKEHSRVFVLAQDMSACAVINFGDADYPGHADHRAVLKLDKTAEYSALLKAASARKPQRAMAEFCEDYIDFLSFQDADNLFIPPATAIKAIRTMKINSKQSVGAVAGNYSREKSLLESTAVDTSEGLPSYITFTCAPYTGLKQRTFMLRLGVGENEAGDPAFMVSIIRHDIAVQEMANELAAALRERMQYTPVLLGEFRL